jgi:two-component system, cell cycle sensor histidine kinase and response regulator CckA
MDEAQSDEQSKATGGLQGVRVLVAEDERGLLQLIRELLVRQGCEVATAADGKEALQLCDTAGPFDVLLTDIVMQGMSGLELATAVHKRSPRTHLLYMSGYDLNERGAEQVQGKRFLRKPFTPKMLIESLRACAMEAQA